MLEILKCKLESTQIHGKLYYALMKLRTQAIFLSKIPNETEETEHNSCHCEADGYRVVPKVGATSLLVTRAKLRIPLVAHSIS